MGKLETAVLGLVLQLFLPKIYNVFGVVFCQLCRYCPNDIMLYYGNKSYRKAMNRNWSNQKANPALKTKTGNK